MPLKCFYAIISFQKSRISAAEPPLRGNFSSPHTSILNSAPPSTLRAVILPPILSIMVLDMNRPTPTTWGQVFILANLFGAPSHIRCFYEQETRPDPLALTLWPANTCLAPIIRRCPAIPAVRRRSQRRT